MKELIEKLEYAKEAVQTCLNDMNCLVDMRGLEYWAKEVVRLRNEIIKKL